MIKLFKSDFKKLKQFTKLNVYTQVFVILFLLLAVIMSALWYTSGKTYLTVGNFQVSSFVIGAYEGRTFYSTIITYTGALLVAFYLLVEKQGKHPLIAFIMSALVVQSASFTFEYVYLLLFWQVQVLLEYYPLINWWLGLLAGYLVGFGFGFMRLNKIFFILFSLFVLTMVFWYLGGYPQLVHKETPEFTAHNYINLPVESAYSLNALSKFFGFMATASLLIKVPKKSR